MYTHILILAFTVLSLHGSLISVFADSTVPGATPQERASAGIVTGIDGPAVASTVSSAQTRALRVGDLLQSGDEIRVVTRVDDESLNVDPRDDRSTDELYHHTIAKSTAR